MTLLYYQANLTNRLVVGTGDKSELLLGCFTKYGDGGVDILPIADLYKTEVRELGEVLGINRRIIAKKSSPRLCAGQLAEAEMGLGYDIIDQCLAMKFDWGLDFTTAATKLELSHSKAAELVRRCDASAHKRGVAEICRIR